MKSAAGITMIGVGALLIYAGFKNKSVWQQVLDVVRS